MNIQVYPIGTNILVKNIKTPGYIDQICITKGNNVKYGIVYYADKIRQSIWVDFKEIEIASTPDEMLRIHGFAME